METRPMYRVGAAGLDPRDWRLVEIVFKHSQYNRYEFVLTPAVVLDSIDLLIANPLDPAGAQAVSRAVASGRSIPVIEALPRGEASGAGRHAIAIDRLTLQLLPILNRVVDAELSGGGASSPAAAPGSATSRTSAPGVASGTTGPGVVGPGAAAPGFAPSVPGLTRAESSGQPRPVPLRPSIDEFDPTALDTDLPSRGASRAARGNTIDVAGDRGRDAPHGRQASAARNGPPTIRGLSQPSAGEGMRFDPPAPAAAPAPPATKPFVAPPNGQRDAGSASSSTVPASASIRPAPQVTPERALAPAPVAKPAAGAASPMPAAAPGHANGAASPAGPATGSHLGEAPKLQVLIVDDSPTVRQQLALAIERMGMACVSVDSAAHALDRLATQHIDLVLADVVMPDMDGYKLTREIKRNRQTRQIPVIILTSKSSPFDLARGALAGCDSYLSKPVPMRALEAAVVKQLRKSLAIDDLSAVIKTAETTGKPPAASTGGRRPLSQWWSRSGS